MSVEAALQRALTALNTRRPQEAEQIARNILSANPRHVGTLRVIGYALLMQNRFTDAIAMLEPIARSLHNAEFDTQLGVALRGAGRNDEALARLKRAIKRKPPHAGAFLELGTLQIASQDYGTAIETLKLGLEIAPMLIDLSLQLGFVQLRVRDFNSAKASFSRVLNLAPASPDALYGLASAHQELGENGEAIGFLRRCLVAQPQHWDAWLSLGQCLLETGQRQAGYECFRTVARGDARRTGNTLASLVKSPRGRFWIRPSAAKQFLRETRS